MDLREYYGKIRAAAAELPAEFSVVVSLATADGGREGVRTEVDRQLAAKMIVDGRARVATPEETAEFRKGQADALKQAKEEEYRRHVKVTLVAGEDLSALRKSNVDAPDKGSGDDHGLAY